MADTTETEPAGEVEEEDKNCLSKLVTDLGIMEILNREYKIFEMFIGTVAAWTTLTISFVSFIFFLVAYSTSYWAKVKLKNSVGDIVVRDIGLWNECPSYGSCTSEISVMTDAFRSCQAFATIALLVIAASLAFSGAYICWDRMQRHPMLALAITVSKGVSVFCLLLLISIWAENWYKPNYDSPDYTRSLNYSYGFAVTTFVTELFGLLFAAAEYYMTWRDDKKMMGKLVPDAERNNPGYRNSMDGEAGYETTELTSGGGGAGWGELPDKPKGGGADWGELPDLKHKSNDGGWGEMPDLKQKPGGAGWNELPDTKCDKRGSRYSGGDSPITVSPGNLYQYNPERGNTMPSEEFQRYYTEQSSDNIAQKPQSGAQRPSSVSNTSYTEPYVSVSPAGAAYERNRNERKPDIGVSRNSGHQPYHNGESRDNEVRGQGHDYRSDAPPNYGNDRDRSYKRHNHPDDNEAIPSYDPRSDAHAHAPDHSQGKHVPNNQQSPRSSAYESQSLVAARDPAESTRHGAPPSENNPVAPSRRKKSPGKPNPNYDQYNGHDTSQVSGHPVSSHSVAYNQPTSPRPVLSESFI